MKILALDTATEACSVALGIGDRSHRPLRRARARSRRAAAAHGRCGAGRRRHHPGALDAIAFGRGPGWLHRRASRRQRRAGAGIRRGRRGGARSPIWPRSPSGSCSCDPGVRRVLVVNDARMREVYWARFRGRCRVAARRRGTRECRPLTSCCPIRTVDLGWRPAEGCGLARTGGALPRGGRHAACRTCCRGPARCSRWRGRAVAAGQILTPDARCRFMSGIT